MSLTTLQSLASSFKGKEVRGIGRLEVARLFLEKQIPAEDKREGKLFRIWELGFRISCQAEGLIPINKSVNSNDTKFEIPNSSNSK